MNFDKLITIIIPVYNVETYLPRCIESIITQTYEKLEIILVDDGSTDASGAICDNYANRDKRIIVIHKPNGGLSDARNVGIDRLKGKYVTFVDSDDWVEKNYVEYLYSLITEYKADISACDFNYIDKNKHLFNSPGNNGDISVWNRKEAISRLLTGKLPTTSASLKLYNSRFFNEDLIRFPVGKLYEDIPVAYEILLKSDKVVFGNKALYNYFFRFGSISKSDFTPKCMDALENFQSVMPKILQEFPDLSKLCSCALFLYNFGIYCKLDNRKEYVPYLNIVKNTIKQTRNSVIFSKDMSIKGRIRAMATYFGQPLTKALFGRSYIKK